MPPLQETGNSAPVGAALFTLRRQLADDLAGTIRSLSEVGFTAVEALCWGGATSEYRGMLESTAMPKINPTTLRTILDDHGMRVSSAHVALVERDNATQVFDEQDALGNNLLVVPTARLVSGLAEAAFDVDMVHALVERFAVAVDLAAERGMRIGYHTHTEEFEVSIGGESFFEMLFRLFDRRVFAEIDVTWLPEGKTLTDLEQQLEERLLLVHSRGRLLRPLGDASSVLCRIVDLATVNGDPWPALRTAYEELSRIET